MGTTRLQNRDDALQAHAAQLQAGQQELVYLRTWIERLKLELSVPTAGLAPPERANVSYAPALLVKAILPSSVML
jgi:LmbE family N-acetylglucosaminyl deacetylase